MAKAKKPTVFLQVEGEGNAVLNWEEDGIEDLLPYAMGYRDAAEALWDELGPRYKRSTFAEFELLPPLFCARHALELALKWNALRARGVWRLHGGEPPYDNSLLETHRLVALWDHLRDALRQAPGSGKLPSKARLPEIETIIRELELVDAESFVFRYPVTKNATLSLAQHFQFNAAVAMEKLLKAANLLIDLGHEVTDWWDAEAEVYLSARGQPTEPISPRFKPAKPVKPAKKWDCLLAYDRDHPRSVLGFVWRPHRLN
jgi:hypothetical protein